MKIHLATDHAGLDLKNAIKEYFLKSVNELSEIDIETRKENRMNKILKYGTFEEDNNEEE